MDTATVFLCDTTEDAVAEHLSGMYPAQRDPWVSMVNGDVALYINMIAGCQDIQAEMEPDDWEALISMLGREPDVCVTADVSGRHHGSREPERFALELLASFNGLAQDLFADHFWTLTELRSGHRVEGRRFFGPSSIS